jgi:hypothetical protein
VADDRERAGGQNDMDALASKIARLVEPVFLRTRRLDFDDGPEESPLRRRTARRKIEPGPLSR